MASASDLATGILSLRFVQQSADRIIPRLLEMAAGTTAKAFPNGTHGTRGKTFAVDLLIKSPGREIVYVQPP